MRSLDFQKRYLDHADRVMKTVDLLPLLYDKLVILQDVVGFPKGRLDDYVKAGIIVVPVFATSRSFSRPLSKRTRNELGKRSFVRVNFEEVKDLYERTLQHDGKDKQYMNDIAVTILEEWGPLVEDEYMQGMNEFKNSINFEVVVSKALNLPIYAKPAHIKIWERKFSKLSTEIVQARRDYAKRAKWPEDIRISDQIGQITVLEAFLKDLNITCPFGLDIDDLIAFRKDKARTHFTDWLFSQIDHHGPGRAKEETRALRTKLVQEFNELSCSVSQKIRGRSNLMRTSLTGLSTGIAALCNPLLAAPAAALMPIMLDKPLLLLCTRLMKKYSKEDWVLFFSNFKRSPR